jgi:hypothetical protein
MLKERKQKSIDDEEIRRRADERPVSIEHPRKRSYLLLKEEVDLIREIKFQYGRAEVNNTEVVRAAIRVLAGMPIEDGFNVIFKLPKVYRGNRPKQKKKKRR